MFWCCGYELTFDAVSGVVLLDVCVVGLALMVVCYGCVVSIVFAVVLFMLVILSCFGGLYTCGLVVCDGFACVCVLTVACGC